MNTFPIIAKYTPAVLAMMCKHFNLTPEQYRLGVLKRCDTEIANLLDDPDLSPEWREIFTDLRTNVRCAIGDE